MLLEKLFKKEICHYILIDTAVTLSYVIIWFLRFFHMKKCACLRKHNTLKAGSHDQTYYQIFGDCQI